MASLPLTKLIHEGAIVDVSDAGGRLGAHRARAHHRQGRGQARATSSSSTRASIDYYQGARSRTWSATSRMHPGGSVRARPWMAEMEIALVGHRRRLGRPPDGHHDPQHAAGPARQVRGPRRHALPGVLRRSTSTPTTCPDGRSPRDIFPMHHLAFQDGCIHAENVGGDIRPSSTSVRSSAPSRGRSKAARPARAGSWPSSTSARTRSSKASATLWPPGAEHRAAVGDRDRAGRVRAAGHGDQRRHDDVGGALGRRARRTTGRAARARRDRVRPRPRRPARPGGEHAGPRAGALRLVRGGP